MFSGMPTPSDDPRTTPTSIEQHGPSGLAIRWADGVETVLEVRTLRLACACAVCVDEWTGTQQLDPASVPSDVRPIRIEPVGRYALQIAWTDGHDSGIYPYERLRQIADRHLA